MRLEKRARKLSDKRSIEDEMEQWMPMRGYDKRKRCKRCRNGGHHASKCRVSAVEYCFSCHSMGTNEHDTLKCKFVKAFFSPFKNLKRINKYWAR